MESTKQVVLQTKLGQLRGYTRQSVFSDKTYYAFQGIPYAKPPLGELRFKAPQPFGSWEGTRDTLKEGNDPKQAVMFPRPGMDPNQLVEGDEDCLYLNVYINELPEDSSARKPVIVSIHGGGFVGGTGSTSTCGPDILLEEDIVVVTFNYRCGAFGFLSLENEVVPGNAGLKDQTMTLKWVKDNIDSFGGDSNNVTLFGISAGGASVNFHLVSPSSKGLFHKAIVQSGFSSNPWAFQRTPHTIAVILAKTMGCTSENNEEILTFLQSAPADDIVLATKTLSKDLKFWGILGLIFSPCVEVSGSDPFLPDTPANIMKKGDFHKIPVIIGCSANEGSIISLFHKLNDEECSRINANPQMLVPSWMGLKSGSTEEKDATKAIWDFYLKGNPLSSNNFDDYFKYHSDVLFNFGMAETRTGLVEMSPMPVYTYLFTNHSKCFCSISNTLFPEGYAKFASSETCHGADCLFLYVANMMPQQYSSTDKEAIKKHVKAWETFAFSGNPNCKELGVKWEKDTKTNPCYMDIGTTWTMKEGTPFTDRMDFWKSLSSKYCNP